MTLAFFVTLALAGRWRARDAALALAGLMIFWIAEDFLWFLLNPVFGWGRFSPVDVPWHRHWLLGSPTDYWVGLLGGALILSLVNRGIMRTHVGKKTSNRR